MTPWMGAEFGGYHRLFKAYESDSNLIYPALSGSHCAKGMQVLERIWWPVV